MRPEKVSLKVCGAFGQSPLRDQNGQELGSTQHICSVLEESEGSIIQGTQSREMISDRQPVKEGPEGRGPPCPSLKGAPGATMLLTRPGEGAGVELRWEFPSVGASGPRKWEGVPRYWKKWPRASCSSSEVMTEGP